MKNKLVVGWSAFTEWELKLARGKARGLIGKYGFAPEDAEDIAQELLLEIHFKRNTSDKWAQVTASKKTVMSRILDNRIREIIDAVDTDKRRVHTKTDSLNTEVDKMDDDSPATLEDFLGDDHVVAYRRQPSSTPQDLQIELSLRAHNLSDLQKRISDLLKQGFNITETAKALGMKRTTLNREIGRMKKLFYKNGLHKYL